jgi:hypothetical protein
VQLAHNWAINPFRRFTGRFPGFQEFGKNLDNLDSGKNDYVGLSFHARP